MQEQVLFSVKIVEIRQFGEQLSGSEDYKLCLSTFKSRTLEPRLPILACAAVFKFVFCLFQSSDLLSGSSVLLCLVEFLRCYHFHKRGV